MTQPLTVAILPIFIQPPIDPLLIFSVRQGNGCSAWQSTGKSPGQAVTAVGQPNMW